MTEFEKDIARHKVVSGGRRVGFPSDGLTKKEREALNSEVRSWNTKRVMPWGTYKQMPGDLQKEYLSNLIQTWKFSGLKCGLMKSSGSTGIR